MNRPLLSSLLAILVCLAPAKAEDEAPADENIITIVGTTADEIADSLDRIRGAIPAEKLRPFNKAVMKLSYFDEQRTEEELAFMSIDDIRRDIAAGLHEYRGLMAGELIEEHSRLEELIALEIKRQRTHIPHTVGLPSADDSSRLRAAVGPRTFDRGSLEERRSSLKERLDKYKPWRTYWREHVLDFGGKPEEIQPFEGEADFNTLEREWVPNPDKAPTLVEAEQGFSVLDGHVAILEEHVATIDYALDLLAAQIKAATEEKEKLARQAKELRASMVTEFESGEPLVRDASPPIPTSRSRTPAANINSRTLNTRERPDRSRRAVASPRRGAGRSR